MTVCSAKSGSKQCATPPRLLRKSDPVYPREDISARIEGTVVLNAVIGLDGKVHEVHVTRSLKPNFDQAAILAVQQWEFQPGSYLGKAVATNVNIEVNFRLTQNPNSSANAETSTASQELQRLNVAATDAYGRRDYATAAKLARRLAALAPRHRNAWNLLGISLLGLHQYAAAADALKKQIEVDPAAPYAYNNLGRVYASEHKYDLAVEQYKKQLAINPEDRYTYPNLASALYAEKKYSEAATEFQKALTITPSNVTALLGLAECDLELGNKDNALDEFSRAASAASSPVVWNNAAYQLATHNLELERAQKWAESAVETESAGLRDVPLDRLTPLQMDRARALAVYWDTLGWVHFIRGNSPAAESYIKAAWKLSPSITVGDHLGQIFEKLGRRDDALHLYSMALASASSSDENRDQDTISEVRQRLLQLAGQDADLHALTESGKIQLAAQSTISVPNPGRAQGTAEFVILTAAPDKILDARQLEGAPALEAMTGALRSARSPLDLSSADVEIPRRGTMTCTAGQRDCQLVLLSASEASDAARRDAGAEAAALVSEFSGQPAAYKNPAMGIVINLPEGWKLVSEQPPSFTQPAGATFQKPGTLAAILVMRQHLEATPEMYRKIMEDAVSKREDFVRTSVAPVVCDGLQGERWNIRWKESNGIPYQGILELFSVEDEHYEVVAEAPTEIFSRYTNDFDETLKSMQFPMAHVTTKDVLPQTK